MPQAKRPPRGGARTWQRAFGLWLVIQLMICAVGPVLRLDSRVSSTADDCGCPISCTCRSGGCCTCREQALTMRSLCTCAGSDAGDDALSGRWAIFAFAAPTISGPNASHFITRSESNGESWLVPFELDHPPRPPVTNVIEPTFVDGLAPAARPP